MKTSYLPRSNRRPLGATSKRYHWTSNVIILQFRSFANVEPDFNNKSVFLCCEKGIWKLQPVCPTQTLLQFEYLRNSKRNIKLYILTAYNDKNNSKKIPQTNTTIQLTCPKLHSTPRNWFPKLLRTPKIKITYRMLWCCYLFNCIRIQLQFKLSPFPLNYLNQNRLGDALRGVLGHHGTSPHFIWRAIR